MSMRGTHRSIQAVAVATVGVPAALLAHLLATGAPAPVPGAVLTVVAVLLVAAAVPVRTSAGLAVVTALTQVAAQSVLAALTPHGRSPACLPAVGRAASLGLHLTLLSPDRACPRGDLGITPTLATALSALLAAGLILLGNALVAVGTGLLLGRTLAATELLALLVEVLDAVLARATAVVLRWFVLPDPVGTARWRGDVPRPVRRPERETARRRGPPAVLRPVL